MYMNTENQDEGSKKRHPTDCSIFLFFVRTTPKITKRSTFIRVHKALDKS